MRRNCTILLGLVVAANAFADGATLLVSFDFEDGEVHLANFNKQDIATIAVDATEAANGTTKSFKLTTTGNASANDWDNQQGVEFTPAISGKTVKVSFYARTDIEGGFTLKYEFVDSEMGWKSSTGSQASVTDQWQKFTAKLTLKTLDECKALESDNAGKTAKGINHFQFYNPAKVAGSIWIDEVSITEVTVPEGQHPLDYKFAKGAVDPDDEDVWVVTADKDGGGSWCNIYYGTSNDWKSDYESLNLVFDADKSAPFNFTIEPTEGTNTQVASSEAKDGVLTVDITENIKQIAIQPQNTGDKVYVKGLYLQEKPKDALTPASTAAVSAASTAYYDLSGRQVAAPAKGINIKVTTTADGQRKAVAVRQK